MSKRPPDLDEAFAVLEVSSTASAEEVRRAYLRKLKRHPPERDPEGFMRLREAFDLARLAASVPERSSGSSDPVEGLTGDQPPGEAPASREGEVVHVDADVVLPYLARLADLPDSAPPEERVAIAREAVADLPDSAEAQWFLVDVLDFTRQPRAMVEALATGHARGWPGFLLRLALEAPEELTPSHLEDALRCQDPVLRLVLARLLLERHGPEPLRALWEAVESRLTREEELLAPLLPFFAELLLALVVVDAIEEARALYRRIDQRLEALGGLVSYAGRMTWVASEELLIYANDLPPEVCRSFARALLQPERGELALYPLKNAISRYPDSMELLLPRLEERAPALYGLLGAVSAEVFHREPEMEFNDWHRSLTRGLLLFVVLLILALFVGLFALE